MHFQFGRSERFDDWGSFLIVSYPYTRVCGSCARRKPTETGSAMLSLNHKSKLLILRVRVLLRKWSTKSLF